MKRNPRLIITLVSFVVMIVAFGMYWAWRKGGTILSTQDHKAVLSIVSQNVPKLNQPYKVKVMVDTSTDTINSVGIYLRFDPQKLRVSEVDTLRSFCQFYPEKKFDNQLGSIALACGAPHPGVKGESELMTITFLPIAEGTSRILVDGRSVVLRSDGKGTNILSEFPSLEVATGVSL